MNTVEITVRSDDGRTTTQTYDYVKVETLKLGDRGDGHDDRGNRLIVTTLTFTRYGDS